MRRGAAGAVLSGGSPGHRGGYDPGLQSERTALAWRRTSLSILAAVLVSARITLSGGPAAALVVLLLAVPLAAWLMAAADRRYGAATGELAASGALPDGVLPALLAATVVALGAGDLLYLLSR